MSSLSSSSASIPRKKYDVFLSFRGEDTRKNFTDHLYAALKTSGIITFRDDQRLEPGEEIALELFTAIRESWCSIIVFSETYAFSGWCLDELAEIVKQKDESGHKIFPIFYDVDPSNLRKQTGKVQEAFAKHEERCKEDKEKMANIKVWRSALTRVANIKGWHSNNRHESELIGDIIKEISEKLNQTYPSDSNELIGINSRLAELHSKIDIGQDDIRIIGICGMGGLGKTTLARVLYTQLSPHFEGKSFLADVREVSQKSGLVSLQEQLLSQTLLEQGFNLFDVDEGNVMISHRLSHKKVLVVIDDVDNIQHLKCLAGKRNWFGLGSRIIITTRDEHLLQSFRVDDEYKPTTLNADEALRLFSLKAFDSDKPEYDFIDLSKHVVEYADGLPLALKVLGSFLCRRDAAQWRSAIERLKRDSNKEIHDKLQISFDGLEESEKNMFLDIACFFKGENKDFVMQILNGCEFFPDIGIDVLIKKSLITIDKDEKFKMHDLLQQMGRNIVRQKCLDEPGKRCRLWEERDVYHVLSNNTATEAVEGMFLDNKGYENKELNKMFTLSADAFLKMKKLRLFKVFYLPNSSDNIYVSNELRLFEWHGYPLKSLPSSFHPENLVALLLPYGRTKQLWKGNRHLDKLKFVNLEGSQNLIKIPDFTMAPNLESLILEGCIRVVDVHPSVTLLRRLKILNLRGCKSLRSLPTKIRMASLENFVLSGCSKLESFPEIDGEMECLLELYLDGTGIKELPSSIGHLSRLKLLNLKDCKRLRSLPTKIGMASLEKLILSGCSRLEMFPEIDGEMECLSKLYLDGTNIEELPSSIGHLSSLVLLNLKDCRNLVSLPSSIDGLKCLKTLNLCGCSKVENLPENLLQVEFLEELDLSATAIRKPQSFIFQLKNLKVFSFNGCKGSPSKLQINLPSLFKVMQRGSTDSMALTLPPLSGLSSLKELDLSDCNLCEGAIPSDIYRLFSLEMLDLSGNNFISLPVTLTRLPKLCYLQLSDCRELKSLPELLSSVESLRIDGCTSLEVLGDPSDVCNSIEWRKISALNCYKLAENNNALTMLQEHLKVSANVRKLFDILVPGSQIPEWFSHQNDESSIKISLPPNIRNDCKWMGVVSCHVIVPAFNADDALRVAGMGFQAVIHGRNSRVDPSCAFLFGREYRRPGVRKNHLWLRYWSRDSLYPFSFEEKRGETENLSSTEYRADQECNEIELLVCSLGADVHHMVKKCGVRIVYEKDFEDVEQITAQHSHSMSPTSANFDDSIHQQDEADQNGALHLLKRKRNIYEEEAGPCEGDSVEESPQPKRFEKFLNFITGKKHSGD